MGNSRKNKTLKLAVVLGGNLGDGLIYSTALRPLRDRFPDAEITLIAPPTTLHLFSDLDSVDVRLNAYQLILGPWIRARIPGRKQLSRWTRWIWSRPLRFDRVIFLNQFVTRLEIDLLEVFDCDDIWGFTGGGYLDVQREDWDSRLNEAYSITKEQRRGDHLLRTLDAFLDQLGCGPVDGRVPFSTKVLEEPNMRPRLAAFVAEPCGLIFPGCTYRPDIKVWPVERYAQAITQMLEAQALRRWLVVGKSNEVDLCEKVVNSTQSLHPGIQIHSECDLDLGELVALVSRSTFALGADNGGMHLAVALDVPSVTILSGAAGNLYFPWGDPHRHRAISKPLDCWHCFYECVHPRPLCIEDITAAGVAALSDSVIRGSGP